MKFLTRILFALLISQQAFAGLTFCNRFQSSTLSAPDDFSAGDTTGTDNGTPTYGPTYARYSTNGLQVNGSAERVEFAATGILSPSVGSIGLWVQFPTIIPAGGVAQIFAARGTNSSDTLYLLFAQTGADRFLRMEHRHNTGGTLSITVDTTAAAGNWYYVKAAWNSATNYRRIELYNTSLVLVDSAEDLVTSFAANVPADLTLIRQGDVTGNTDERWYDSLLIGSTETEPFVENATITTCSAYASGVSGGLLLRRRRN